MRRLSSGYSALRNILNIRQIVLSIPPPPPLFLSDSRLESAFEFNETERPPINTTFLRDNARFSCIRPQPTMYSITSHELKVLHLASDNRLKNKTLL